MEEYLMRMQMPDGTTRRPEDVLENLGSDLMSGKVSIRGFEAALKDWFPSLARDPEWLAEQMEEANMAVAVRDEKA